MRAELSALVLVAGLATSGAAAAPEAAPGFIVEPVIVDLATPSGIAALGDALVFSDLTTGRVVRRDGTGRQTVLTENLPFGKDVMGSPTGPYKLAVLDGRLFTSQGWQDVDRDEGPLDHAIVEITPGTGPPRALSNDFWNPYDFEHHDGVWYVADAARNALMTLDAEGAVSELFAFPDLVRDRAALSVLSPTEFQGGEPYEVDAVPTGVAVLEGRVYVALFGGFPYLDGGGLVVSVAASGDETAARVEVRGLDAPIDVAFDDAGGLLVVEMGRFELEGGFLPGSGRLLRVDLATGAREVLLTGLDQPVTVLPRPGGGAVVVQMSGSVLRLRRR
jgi:hypothetical protein